MLIDFFFGAIGLIIGLLFGYGWSSSILFFAAFVLDGDIIVNELYRIFIKKEKKLGLKNFLDEYSYSHKYIFHLPLVAVPVSFFVTWIFSDWVFATLVSVMILYHLIHDTVDKNWDGVPWLYPFSKYSYKFTNGRWTKKSREQLRKIAEELAKSSRESTKIFGDNLMV